MISVESNGRSPPPCLTPFLALSLVLLLLLSFPLSYFVARTFGLLRILITRWETTKMKGGADEDYSFLFKGERVMENMPVSFCHFQKVFHVVHHHQKSFFKCSDLATSSTRVSFEI